MESTPIVIIGAGPYGLSAAAHLKAQNVSPFIAGKPMEFWRNMPPQMYLKSSWSSISISDPAHAYTLDRFSALRHLHRQEPVPLQVFLEYARWFQQELVPDIEQTYVTLLARDGEGFHLELADGRSLKAGRVIVASGIAPFAHIPSFTANLSTSFFSHTQQHPDFAAFKGKRVVVIGSGQSAFEAAALLAESSAEVELIARGPVIWIKRHLYRYTGITKRLFYPPSDIGPAGISWIVAFPLLLRYLPEKTRLSIDTRSVRPAVAPWMQPRVEGKFTITPHTSIVEAVERGEKVCLKLSDGTTRQADHIVLGTGYRPDVQKLAYIDPSLRRQVGQQHGYPILNKWFESSIPHLYFVGSLAGYIFGPLCRFVAGAGVSARQVTRHTVLDR